MFLSQIASFINTLNEQRGTWGPYLIIVPAAYVRLWACALATFCPALNVLPYCGDIAHRAAIRRTLKGAQVPAGTAASTFHVMLTSIDVFSSDTLRFFASFV